MAGTYPYYGPTGVLDNINEHRIEGKRALIGEDGDHFLKYATMPMTLMVEGKYNVNNHAHIVGPTNMCTAEWFYLFFMHRDITNMLSRQGVGRFKLNKETLKKLPILLPPIREQVEIYKAISTWDRAIQETEALIAAKERRKKWLTQQLLTGRVRFGEFAGKEWPKKPLGTLFKEVTDMVGEKDIPPYSISAGVGFVSQREKWGKDIAGKQYSKYTHIRKGEFAFNKGNSKRYQCGCAYVLRNEEEVSVPNVFICFRRKQDNVCTEFYEHFFVADYHASELKQYISSGARADGLLNLNKKDFFKMLVPCPEFAEQRAIAAVLNASVTEIEAHRRHLGALKEQKKGLMQQLLTGKVRVKGG